MKPLNRKHIRFPTKTDYHTKRRGWLSWWEDIAFHGKGKLKQILRKEIDEELKGN